MTELLSVRKASKRFLTHQVFSNLSFALQPRSVTLLLGANGAGKSTLLRSCVGLARLDSGEVRYKDLLPGEVPHAKLAYLGHQLYLYSQLTVAENLRLAAKLTGVRENPRPEEWGLEAHADKLIWQLSKGLQARTALMRALLGSPELIILDEPTSALDEDGVKRLVARIKDTRERGGSALIATHDAARLAAHADRIAVMKDGAIAADSGDEDEAKRKQALAFYAESNR